MAHRLSKDWELARRYLDAVKKSGRTGNLEPWEEELFKWEPAQPILTQPSPEAMAKLYAWDRDNSN